MPPEVYFAAKHCSICSICGCRKQQEEQDRAELLARRSGAPNWQSEVSSSVYSHECSGQIWDNREHSRHAADK